MKKTLKKFALILALCLSALAILPACQKPAAEPDTEGTPYAIIKIKDYGTVKVQLMPEVAPITVQNFINLAESGYYDGLSFHRIVNGFMMQGGWDLNGEKQTVDNIKGEFSANGVENPLSHTKGVISMARGDDYNSASSQFFICQVDCTFLDGKYAAFGCVTDGLELVEEICSTIPQGVDGTLKEQYRAWIETITIEYHK